MTAAGSCELLVKAVVVVLFDGIVVDDCCAALIDKVELERLVDHLGYAQPVIDRQGSP